MMPTEVIIAIAVESAATRTEVRRSDAGRLRDASNASTPRSFRSGREAMDVAAATTKAGIASAEATIRSSVGEVAEQGFSADCRERARPALRPATPAR